jgi:hypothetical protein
MEERIPTESSNPAIRLLGWTLCFFTVSSYSYKDDVSIASCEQVGEPGIVGVASVMGKEKRDESCNVDDMPW